MTDTVSPSSYSDPDLVPRLDALDKANIPALPLEMRCRIFQHIRKSVEKRVQDHKLYTVDDNNQVTSILTAPFVREEDALIKLLQSFHYTDRYKDFFKRNAEKLGQEIAQTMPLQALPKEWAEAGLSRKLSHLKNLARTQFNLFAHDGLHFTPPEIETIAMPPDIAGRYESGSHNLSSKVRDKRIYISSRHIQNSPPHEVYKTQWHEGVHSLCQNFAAACHQGLLTRVNPFYADAQVECERKKYGAATSSVFFPRAYQADPEERLAYETENVFFESWRAHSKHVILPPPPTGLMAKLKKFFL